MERVYRVDLTAYDARETKEILIQLCSKNVQTERCKRYAPFSRAFWKKERLYKGWPEYRVTFVGRCCAIACERFQIRSCLLEFFEFSRIIFAYQKYMKGIQTGRNFIFFFSLSYNRLLVSRRECFNKDSSSISGWEIIPFTEIPWPFANGIMSYTLRVQFDETNGEDRTAARQVAREISARVRRSIEPAVRYGSLGN